MIRVDSKQLKVLMKGEPVILNKGCRSTRRLEPGRSYPIVVDTKPSELRVVVVASKRKMRKGKATRAWKLTAVLDRQEPARYLPEKSGAGYIDEAGNCDYQSSPVRSLDGAEALSAAEQAKMADMARRRSEEKRAADRQRREAMPLERRLAEARSRAEAQGRSIRGHERAIERRLLTIEESLEDAA